MYPAVFKVKYYNEFSDKIDNIEETQGILFGTSFADTAHTLEETFGDDLIQLEITLLESSSILELPIEVINKIKEENNI